MQRIRRKRASPGATAPVRGPLFPPRQAFVVHFQADSDATARRCAGRVEHVLSGRGARFASSAALLAFMQEVLRQLADEPASSSAPDALLLRRTEKSLSRDRNPEGTR